VSEAIAFASAAGLDVSTVLEVLNVSSGRSSATSDKFPNHVVSGTFASGFTNSLMVKDLGLYLDAVATSGTDDTIGAVTAEVWRRFAETDPAVDFTRIYPFVAGASD
jgi:3-hydroxyisobutyrate dehydrogenase-like beta-hydroxyacid dehydrogenase